MTTIHANKAELFLLNYVYVNDEGVVVDVTGHTTYIYVAKHFGQTALATIPGTIVSGLDGQVRYECDSLTTFAAMDHGAYQFSQYLVDADNNIVSVVSGAFILTPAITEA